MFDNEKEWILHDFDMMDQFPEDGALHYYSDKRKNEVINWSRVNFAYPIYCENNYACDIGAAHYKKTQQKIEENLKKMEEEKRRASGQT